MSHPRPKILFIAGIGRSGSTLLSRMLAQIDGFQAVGELHHLWQTGAPCWRPTSFAVVARATRTAGSGPG